MTSGPRPFAGPLAPGSAIGVDVMDRRSARLQQLPRDRTVRRILSGAEAERLARSDDPVRDFWLHWGAKEAAFKTVTLVRGEPPVFAHARFEVELARQRVYHDGIDLALAVEITPERLVVVARPLAAPDPAIWAARTLEQEHAHLGNPELDALRATHFSPRERDTIRGLPSALARLGVRREAAIRLAVDEARLAVICPPGVSGRRPPYLHLDGRPLSDVGISLSHDGAWVAWGLSLGPEGISAARAGS